MLFLDFHYVLSEDADPIIGSKVFVAIEISEFWSEIIPFHVVLDVLRFHQESEVVHVFLFYLFLSLLFLIPEFIKVILESIFLIDIFENAPSWICQKVILNFVHFGVRCEEFSLLEHFEELSFVDFGFGFFFDLIGLFKVNNVVIESFLFVADFHQHPSLIVLTHFDTGLPFGVDVDSFGLEEGNEFFLFLLFFREFLFKFEAAIQLALFLFLLFHFAFVLFDFIGELPARLSIEGIVEKLFAFSSTVLFPFGVVGLLLSGLETLGHLVLGFFCCAIVVVSDTIHRLVDWPYLTFLLQSDWIVDHFTLKSL